MSNSHTETQYNQVLEGCKDIFAKKTKDYGTAWRILRPSSLTDQIYIKAARIRTIQEKGSQKVADDITSEFKGIINYCLIALVQLDLGRSDTADLTAEEALTHFEQKAQIAKELMQRKNHDYGEAWRMMRVSSMTDLILQKLLRIKQIEDNEGKTLVSEGLDANYLDIVNYAIFCLILLSEQEEHK